jgi:hypothetical protein
MKHELFHALRPEASGCSCSRRDIQACVICGKDLRAQRAEVDTCGKVCSRRLLAMQREQL